MERGEDTISHQIIIAYKVRGKPEETNGSHKYSSFLVKDLQCHTCVYRGRTEVTGFQVNPVFSDPQSIVSTSQNVSIEYKTPLEVARHLRITILLEEKYDKYHLLAEFQALSSHDTRLTHKEKSHIQPYIKRYRRYCPLRYCFIRLHSDFDVRGTHETLIAVCSKATTEYYRLASSKYVHQALAP